MDALSGWKNCFGNHGIICFENSSTVSIVDSMLREIIALLMA